MDEVQRETIQSHDAPQGFASAARLVKKVDSMQRERQLKERQWKLNMAFYKGNQYVFYNRKSRRIESLPTDEGDKPRYRVRLVANQIAPNTQALLSRLVKSKPQFYATPGQASYEAQKASKVAEDLLEYWWDAFHLSSKREEAMMWSIIAGNGFWKVSWDDKAGPGMKVTMSPDGQPIVDPLVEHFFKKNLELQGEDAEQFDKRIYQGEIKVDVLSPFDVLLDDQAQVFEDCKFAICIHPASPEEIFERYGVMLKPNAVNRYPDESLPGAFGNLEAKTTENVRILYYGYYLPGPKYPDGRFVVFTKDPSIVLYDAPWPYPFEELPLVKFPGLRIPGQLWDWSVVENAIPLQKELNRTLSQIIEYKNLTMKPQMLAPVGSLRQRITDEPGAIFEYNPVAGKVPEALPVPSMPPYVFEHLKDLGVRLQDAFGLNEIMDGKVPPNVEAGVAIDLLQESATDRLAPQIILMEKSLERAGNLMLQLAQQYYNEPRTMIITGSGSKPKVERFEDADLIKGVSVKVEAGSGLPRTRAGKQARVMQMLQMGILSPTKAYKYMDMADFKGVQMEYEADNEQAMREHDIIMDGGIINEQAANEAKQALQQQMMTPDPQTGQVPPMDPNALQDALDAGLKPLLYENMDTHMEAHASYMKSAEFESMPFEIRQRFYKHYELTLDRKLELAAIGAGQPPKVSLQLRSAIGPTVGQKVLQSSGIRDLTTDNLLEPSIDTVVVDNKDKPNASDAAQQGVGQYQQEVVDKMIANAAINQQKVDHERQMQAAKNV